MPPVRTRLVGAFAALLCVPFLVQAASAQPCPDPWGGDYYWTQQFPPPGIEGDVQTSAVYQNELYIGGNFQAIGDRPIAGVARWDGSGWQPVGEGGPTAVNALGVHDSELYAATVGYNAIEVSHWDGSTWSTLPPVGAFNPFFVPVTVEKLTTYDGDLYLAGNFEAIVAAGTDPGVLRWDGTEWSLAGTGARANDLLVHDGLLYACYTGSLDTVGGNVAAFDGTSWQPVGAGLPGAPERLAEFQGDLIAAGTPDGASGSTVDRWDGISWSTIQVLDGTVDAAAANAQFLVLSGSFSQFWPGLVRYDGAQWTSVGSGADGRIFTLTWMGQDLIAGGEFSAMDGIEARRVARNALGAWSAMGEQAGPGLDGSVYALASYNGDLIAGGNFAVMRDPDIRNLARWDGTRWHALGNPSGVVNALALFDGKLAVGTSGGSIDGVNMNGKLPVWDGSTWSSLGLNLYGQVTALQVWNGDLYAGGSINSYQSTSGPRYVARWNGSNWETLGAGFDYIDSQYRHVRALGVWNDMLIVGGGFPGVDGVVGPLAAWDGTDWLPLGSLFNEFDFTVYAIASFHGELVIGGDFCETGGMCRIARYNGSSWSDLAGGLLGESVSALRVFGDMLYVAGYADYNNNAQLEHGIAAWNGSCWLPLGNGLGLTEDYHYAAAMAEHDGVLYVGGEFGTAGGRISRSLSAWSDPAVLATPGPGTGDAGFVLGAARPNPVRGAVSARLELQQPGRVRAGVYAVDGSRVASLLDRRLDPGSHALRWSGRDDRGRFVANGVYFLNVSVDGRTRSQRLVVSR